MTLPTHYAVLLYPGFQLLDVAGPLDILNLLSSKNDVKLSILSSTMGPVPTMPKTAFSQSIVPTHTFADAPEDIEVLLVPGGLGARDADNIQPAVDYVKKVYPKLQYLITVCTGSALVAKAGVLDGVKATSNKAAFEWVSRLCAACQHTLLAAEMRRIPPGPLSPSSSEVGKEGEMGRRWQYLDELGHQCRYGRDIRICRQAVR